jgi:hypothetical protein
MANRWPKRAYTVLDVRGAGALGSWKCVDDIGSVDSACPFFGVQNGFTMFAHIGGILDMNGPAITRPPSHGA